MAEPSAICETPCAACFGAARCASFPWLVLPRVAVVGTVDGHIRKGWPWGWSSLWGSGQGRPEEGVRRRCRRWVAAAHMSVCVCFGLGFDLGGSVQLKRLVRWDREGFTRRFDACRPSTNNRSPSLAPGELLATPKYKVQTQLLKVGNVNEVFTNCFTNPVRYRLKFELPDLRKVSLEDLMRVGLLQTTDHRASLQTTTFITLNLVALAATLLTLKSPPPPPPRAAAAAAVFAGKIVSGQLDEENPFVLISSGLLVHPDEGVSDPVVDRIGVNYRNLPRRAELL
ncbi:hypothetical protein F511_33033 [Dorcoceras hygrometricum]|uniref:Uncharacterized protein n=1 Tax=Dorcoceras hygrometricum TaxID=472368 RepID=A0A2Z7CD59_9LAMI|nr:hypothetical protein F511_33033 [Dorcoceras hygrometricum]